MSLRQIQTRNFLEFIISSYLASGKRPTDTEIFKALNFYFSKQPAGQPIKLEKDLFRKNVASNVDNINDFMAAVQINLDNLFQQIDEHLDQNTLLTTALLAQMKSVRADRKRLEDRVDDILLSLYNTDGYFYSASDDFFDGSLVDFNFTDAFLDVESGTISLPTNSDHTKLISLYNLNQPIVDLYRRKEVNKTKISFTEETPFKNAVDGLTNTAWYIKAKLIEPSDGVIARISLDFYTGSSDVKMTQIVVHPYGVEPVQCSIQKVLQNDAQTSSVKPFSNYIKKSAEKMVFINEEPDDEITRIIFEISKEKADYYEDNTDGTRSGIYIIGIRELMITQQAYDPAATFVSMPLSIPSDLEGDQTIDSISITTKHNIPPNSKILYYIAPDNPNATVLSDFDWKQINPLSETGATNPNSLVRMNGAQGEVRYIRSVSGDATDIPIIKINKYTKDPNVKNPTYSISSEFPVYRIAPFKDQFLTGTLTLEEGINTTKILYTTLSDQNIENTFEFWKAKFDLPGSYISTFGETDTGNEFFYGADVGENARSVYIETNIYAEQDYPVVLKDIIKSNPNSKLWVVKAYLNGREVADMPAGTDRVTAPIKLNRGKNNVVFAVNIPPASNASFIPYVGSIAFDMGEFGGFKLGELTYVDLYKFKDNGYRDDANISPNKWFTIYNGEIVTRSNITTNYRLKFARATSDGPEAIRLRADLSRFDQNNRISPILDSYRVRFSYADKEQ